MKDCPYCIRHKNCDRGEFCPKEFIEEIAKKRNPDYKPKPRIFKYRERGKLSLVLLVIFILKGRQL